VTQLFCTTDFFSDPIEDKLMVTSSDNIVYVKETATKKRKTQNKNRTTQQRAKVPQYVPLYRKDLFYRGNIMARHTKNTAENWIGQTPKREGFLLS
jgi:hypothetical protein